MGNYAAVLAKMECPRDPTLLDPPTDEGMTTGVIRRSFLIISFSTYIQVVIIIFLKFRKLTINFGSPYQKKHNRKKSNDVDIDERASMDDIRNIFADSPLPHHDVEQTVIFYIKFTRSYTVYSKLSDVFLTKIKMHLVAFTEL